MPGVLMGLALMWLYLATTLRVILDGSMTGLVLAMLIKEVPVGTQLLKAGFLRLGNELEEAARVCGATPAPATLDTGGARWLLSLDD